MDRAFHYIDGTPKLKSSFQTFITPDVLQHQFIGPSPKRRALILQGDFSTSGSFIVHPGPVGTGANGFVANTTTSPLYFTLENIGSLIQGPWSCQGNAGGVGLAFIEVVEE